jgi:ATP-binding cassette, subfamily C (CFTR/MRP), member 4
LFTKEKDEIVVVDKRTYAEYFSSGQKFYNLFFIIILLIGTEIIFTQFNSTISKHKPGSSQYINRLGYLTIGYFLVLASKYSLMFKFFLDCNTGIYEKLVFNVLRIPIVFFDKTPTGRIINRFSNDISVLDNVIV